jgi:hypothetical protein
MTPTFTLTLNLTAKTGRVTNTTEGFSGVTQGARFLGNILFQGEIIVEKDTIGSPLIDLSTGATYYEFPLELDNTGAVAYGTYQVQNAQIVFEITATSFDGDGIILFAGQGDIADLIEEGQIIEVTEGDNAGDFTVETAENLSGVLLVNVLEQGIETSVDALCYIYFETASDSWTYSGCTQLEACVELTPDCNYGDNGTWAVSNETLFTTQTLVSLTATINYPSWTGEDPIVVTTLPYINNRLAKGTYSVVMSEVISQVETDGLILVYTASTTQEFIVRCSGSLCELNDCIEKLRAANQGTYDAKSVPIYQNSLNNVFAYWIEAQNCANDLDKYDAAIVKLQAALDSSGVCGGCSSCNDSNLGWVYNTSQETQDAVAALQVQLDIVAVQNKVIFYSPLPYTSTAAYYTPQPTYVRPFTDIAAITIAKEYFTAIPNGFASKWVEIEFSMYTKNDRQARITVVDGDIIFQSSTTGQSTDELTQRFKVVLSTAKPGDTVLCMVYSQGSYVNNTDATATWIPYNQNFDPTYWDLSADLVLDFTPPNPTETVYTDIKITAISV